MPEYISPESAQFFHQNNSVHIDQPVRSSDMTTIEHMYAFSDRGSDA